MNPTYANANTLSMFTMTLLQRDPLLLALTDLDSA